MGTYVVFLHGILGRGSNWRTIARKVGQVSGVGTMTVDLTNHGGSLGGVRPLTIQATAKDVIETLAAESVECRAVVGHSFGGKVAMLVASQTTEVESLWMLDSSPSLRTSQSAEEVYRVVRYAQSLAGRKFESRNAGVALMVSDGFTRPLAMWFAMNLIKSGSAFELSIDPKATEQQLLSYLQLDGWQLPLDGVACHLVRAENSPVVLQEDLGLAEGKGWHNHLVHDAGHWLHADQPKVLVEMLTRGISGGV